MPSQPDDRFDTVPGASAPPNKPYAWRGTGDVLIADDEPSVRQVTARTLERLGMATTCCIDGAEALDAFRQDPARWRLVVLDLTMPNLGGVDTAIAMRALRADIPIILSSGHSADHLAGSIPDATRTAFLQKPFSMQSLSEAIHSVLGDS